MPRAFVGFSVPQCNGTAASPMCLSPRAASDSGLELAAGAGGEASHPAGSPGPRHSCDGGFREHAPDFRPELLLRLPGDASSATVSENGDYMPASALPSSPSPVDPYRRGHSSMGLLRTGGPTGSGNIFAGLRSISQGNLAHSSMSASGTPRAGLLMSSLSPASSLSRDCAKEAAAEARRIKAAENMRNMERISLQALGDVRGEGPKLPGTPIGGRRQLRPLYPS